MKNIISILVFSLSTGAQASLISHRFIEPYTKADVGLGNVDNTSDLNKPISTAVQDALDDILVSAGITSINSLSGTSQTLVTGSSGTDFGISSAGTVHTFNIPTSSASNRGLLSSSDWSAFNSKVGPFPLQGPLGSAAAPSYRLQDNDSGIYSTGDGNISFSTDGSLRLHLDSLGAFVTGDLETTGDVIVAGNISALNYPPTGNNNSVAGYDGSGNLYTLPFYSVNSYRGIDTSALLTFDDRGPGQTFKSSYYPFRPLQDSASETWSIINDQVEVDPDSDGFAMGTGGEFANYLNVYFKHIGTSDIGKFRFLNFGSDIGNGTDPIDVGGLQIANGFAHIYPNVTVSGQIQGYGFGIQADTGSVIDGYTNPFYDSSNISTSVNGYTSYSSSPIISEIRNNNGFSGMNITANINTFTGNASYSGIFLGGNLGTFDTGNYKGINIAPSVTSVSSADGIFVDMSNVTASGTKRAAYFGGDVQIDGDLSFTGALSIGNLNAYAELNPVVDGAGNPTSVHSLVSSVVVPANATTANADTIGINTAMLVNVGANSNITLGAFGLFSGLALPSVVETHTGSYLPRLQGGVFALNFAGSSTGGTVGSAEAGRFVLIPNGITTIDQSVGVMIDNPFGNPGTVNYGVLQTGAERNSFEGTVESEGGLQLKTSGSKPTCNAAHRGMFWNTEGGTGVADILEICQKDAADSYVWVVK